MTPGPGAHGPHQTPDAAVPALSAGGGAWLSGAEVATAVAATAGTMPPDGAVPVLTDDPVDALVRVLAACRRGVTPLVGRPGLDPLAVSRVLAVLGAEPAGRTAGRGELLALSTSGTTGAPRTILRTVASWAASLGPFTDITGAGPDDVAWSPGVPSSTLTLWALWHAVTTGVPVLATGRWRGVPADPAVDAVTVLHAVPAVLADVLDARAVCRLPALRTAVVAGAALPRALRRRCADLGVRLVEYYGAAELSFVAVDPDGVGLRAFPRAEVRVRDGLVEARSPYLSLGYVASSGPFTLDAEGWGGVGDRGRLGPDGVLEVAGRGDDALSVGGAVIFPADVERVLAAVDGVLEVVCWGEPDDRLGERPAAAVRTRFSARHHPALVRELRAAARAQLPPPARPVRYVLVDELPRTVAGKPDRSRLTGRR